MTVLVREEQPRPCPHCRRLTVPGLLMDHPLAGARLCQRDEFERSAATLFGTTPAVFSIRYNDTNSDDAAERGSGRDRGKSSRNSNVDKRVHVRSAAINRALDFTYASSTELKRRTGTFWPKPPAESRGIPSQRQRSGDTIKRITQEGFYSVRDRELWQTLNNSQNTLFRDLPSTWTSIRLKLATFNPSQLSTGGAFGLSGR